jgi:hypothetical protein
MPRCQHSPTAQGVKVVCEFLFIHALCVLIYTFVYTTYINTRIRITIIIERATLNTGHCAENAVLYDSKGFVIKRESEAVHIIICDFRCAS